MSSSLRQQIELFSHVVSEISPEAKSDMEDCEWYLKALSALDGWDLEFGVQQIVLWLTHAVLTDKHPIVRDEIGKILNTGEGAEKLAQLVRTTLEEALF